jgi:hypothetical protein
VATKERRAGSDRVWRSTPPQPRTVEIRRTGTLDISLYMSYRHDGSSRCNLQLSICLYILSHHRFRLLSIVLIPAAARRWLVIHWLRFLSGPISVYTRVYCNYLLQNGLREALVNVKAAYHHITRLWQHHDHTYDPIATKMNINVRPTALEPQLPHHLLDLPLEN